jgi:lipoprotein-releasing system ATP-binding protein
MPGMLKASGVKKSYGDLEVLKGVDVTINRGEVVSIVGSSGAGKSTFLHIAGTLDNADEGTIFINEINTTRLKGNSLSSFRNRHIGFIFQFHHLLPEFTALENVCIPGWISGKNKSKTEKRAKELLDLLNISARINNKPNQLSGGEQQRVAVARALINDPSIIFADEPTGNLDSIHAREMHDLFFTLRQELNQTFLIVTHNEELANLSDKKLVMKDGIIVQE